MNNKTLIIESIKEDLRMAGYSLSDYEAAWKMLLDSIKVEGHDGKFKVIKVETENNKMMFPLFLQSNLANTIDEEECYLHNGLSRFEFDMTQGFVASERNYLFAYGESLIVQVTIRFMSFLGDDFIFDNDADKSGNRIGDFTALAWDYTSYKYMTDPRNYGSSQDINKGGLKEFCFLDDSRHSIARQSGLEVLADVFDGHPVIESILQTNMETLYGYKPYNSRNPWDVLIEKLDEYNKQLIERNNKKENQ